VKDLQLVGSKHDSDDLSVAGFAERRSDERPLNDFEKVIASEKADEHGHARSGDALDQNPAKIFEVLEKGLYRAAFLVFQYVMGLPSDVLGHSWNRLPAQAFTPGVDWETVWAGSAWAL